LNVLIPAVAKLKTAAKVRWSLILWICIT